MFLQQMGYKLRHLFLPVVFLSVIMAVCYSMLDWYLVEKTAVLPLDQQMVDVWLPGAFSIILVYVFVNPHIRVLNLSENRNVTFFFQIIAAAAIAAPTIVAQLYVHAASGAITTVSKASDIAVVARTKYYKANTICLAHAQALAKPVVLVSGQHNEYLDFYIYVVAPVCAERQADGADRRVWIGLQYHDRVDNRGSDSDKEASYRSFADKSQRAFDAEDTRHYQYLEQVGVNSDRRNFEKALQKGGIDPALSPTILIPHQNPFAQRTGHLLQWLAYAFGIGAALWLFLLLWPSVNAEKLKALKEPTPAGEQNEPSGLALLLPRHRFYGLPILLDVNIGVFLAMAFAGLGVVSFQTDDLLAWGANYGPDIHGLGVFRFVTSQFVHGGIMHLLSNMYGLLFAGMFLAPVARNSRLIACYLLCGLGGSIASFVVHPAIMSVGASGAIMGLWGILLPLILLRDPRISAVAAPILINAAVFVGLTLLIGAVGQGIDNAAHVGGLATGIVIGFVLFFLDRGKEPDVILARSEND